MPLNTQGNVGTGFSAQHRVYSNFFSDNYIIQNVAITQPKNLLIDIMRRHFAEDNVYTYRSDEYGFPLTVDMTGKTRDDLDTTKILITDLYRHEVKFYPAITVKSSGGSYVPISFNQNETIKYRKDIVTDEFGRQIVVSTPTHRVYDGSWEQSFEVSVYSESHSELEEIVEILLMLFQHTCWNELRENGLFIKALNFSGENAQPYSNDYIYIRNITLQVRTEWRVEVPISDIIEKIVFYFDSVKTPNNIESFNGAVNTLKFSDVVEMASIE
jgi:hypothetical protein